MVEEYRREARAAAARKDTPKAVQRLYVRKGPAAPTHPLLQGLRLLPGMTAGSKCALTAGWWRIS